MDEKRSDGTASVANVTQDRRRAARRRYASAPGRFRMGQVTRLEGQLRCERNDVGEIVEIWIGDRELLRTIIDCNDRRENVDFSVGITCSGPPPRAAEHGAGRG